jgi:hypothetical protein
VWDQVVAMVAGYLDVPLRYPVRLGVSHSYIQDYSPAIEPPPSVDIVSPVGTAPVERTVVEFPLFSEGQDQTRSAYAVFLLNKVCYHFLSPTFLSLSGHCILLICLH